MNCTLDLGQALMAYKNGHRGYEPMEFNLRNYVPTSGVSELPYIYAKSFLPCTDRVVEQFGACDYDQNQIEYNTQKPIMFVPLPCHDFSSARLTAKFSAGFYGLTKNPESKSEAYLRVQLFSVVDGKKFVPDVTINYEQVEVEVEGGGTETVQKAVDYVAEAADVTSYSQETRCNLDARQTLFQGVIQRVDLSVSGYFAVPVDGKQYFLAPSIYCTTGVRCEDAFFNVELYHEKI